MRTRGVSPHLAGEHDLVELTCPDQLDRPLHRVLVVRGGRGARNPGAHGRVRIEQRHGGRRERCHAALQSLRHLLGVVVGVHDRADGEPRLAAVPRERHLGEHHRAGRQRRPLGPRPALVPKRKPPDEDRPGGGRAARVVRRVVGERPAPEFARACGDVSETLRASSVECDRLSQSGEGEALALGLLEAEVAVARAPRGKHRRREIELGRERNRQRRDGRSGIATGQRQRPVETAGQQLERVFAKLERMRGGSPGWHSQHRMTEA